MTIYAAFGHWGNTAGSVVLVKLNQGTTNLNPATNPPDDPPTSEDHDPWYTYEPAVKLTPSDVGLAAPDPFCPSGPQS